MRNIYMLDLRLLEQMLLSLDHLLQEVLVHNTVVREVELEMLIETRRGSVRKRS